MKKLIEKMLFGSKWLLVPFYFGLIIAQTVYLFWFCKDVWHLIWSASYMSKEGGMLIILELVDIVMIANLVKMIITGSYHSFVSKNHGYSGENASSGLLKIKMATPYITY